MLHVHGAILRECTLKFGDMVLDNDHYNRTHRLPK